MLTLLILFLSVALFSPLHTHIAGKSGGCSFNNLEHQFIALATAFLLVLVFFHATHRETDAQFIFALVAIPRLHRGRAPPQLF